MYLEHAPQDLKKKKKLLKLVELSANSSASSNSSSLSSSTTFTECNVLTSTVSLKKIRMSRHDYVIIMFETSGINATAQWPLTLV